jgi:hypothetical protein
VAVFSKLSKIVEKENRFGPLGAAGVGAWVAVVVGAGVVVVDAVVIEPAGLVVNDGNPIAGVEVVDEAVVAPNVKVLGAGASAFFDASSFLFVDPESRSTDFEGVVVEVEVPKDNEGAAEVVGFVAGAAVVDDGAGENEKPDDTAGVVVLDDAGTLKEKGDAAPAVELDVTLESVFCDAEGEPNEAPGDPPKVNGDDVEDELAGVAGDPNVDAVVAVDEVVEDAFCTGELNENPVDGGAAFVDVGVAPKVNGAELVGWVDAVVCGEEPKLNGEVPVEGAAGIGEEAVLVVAGAMVGLND